MILNCTFGYFGN